MNETQEQSVPNSGASNAADFQPPTQSPQTAPEANVQDQNGLEGVTNTQEFFNDNKTAEISVTTQPAPAQAQAKNDSMGLAINAIVAVVIAIILYKLSSKVSTKNKGKKESVVEPKTIEEDKPKKSTSKKKVSKKTKRRNR